MYHAKASRIWPNTGRVFETEASKSQFSRMLKFLVFRGLQYSTPVFTLLSSPLLPVPARLPAVTTCRPPIYSKMKKMHHLIRLAFFYIENSIAIDASKSCACISSLKAARLTGTSGRDPQGGQGANVPPSSENWRILGLEIITTRTRILAPWQKRHGTYSSCQV